MTELSIKVEGLSKEYIVGGAEQQYDSFRDMLTNAIHSPFRKYQKLSGSDNNDDRFWALNDINFEINQGDVVGVIGHNGAGKSTLLKILSRITTPTEGRIQVHGRVASLLEVGTGFHPELTGRENIYLNGSILGMKRAEISKKFDEIVDFAGITKFLDTPVKRYSSGMYVRLAFSVAANLETDILLVDEVLAVGDQNFQKKCLGKLDDVSSQGRTVLFVSHNLSAVSSLCRNGIVLDQGKLIVQGEVNHVLSTYDEMAKPSVNKASLSFEHPVTLKNLSLDNLRLKADEGVTVNIELEAFMSLEKIHFNIGIYNEIEQRLVNITSQAITDVLKVSKGVNNYSCVINSLPLVFGRYHLNFAIMRQGELLEVIERAVGFSVGSEEHNLALRDINGPIYLNYSWSMT